MPQTNTTRTLFNVTKVLGILLIGGGVFVLKHGGQAMRKGLRTADDIPREITKTPARNSDDVPSMRHRSVTTTGKVLLSGGKQSQPTNGNQNDQCLDHPPQQSWTGMNPPMMPAEQTAFFE